jgi:hypothetical protein
VRRLELDFERPRRPSVGLQAVLLAVAMAFAVDVGRNHIETRESIAALEAWLAARPVVADPHLLKVAAVPPNPEELEGARETIRRLSTPWNALFRALEASRIGTVAISAVEPDPAARMVEVRGDARNYLAALSFVANLREQRALHDVRLVRHETSADGQGLPLRFTVSASWGTRP